MIITKQFRTETAHRLLNYNGRCAHLHGHSYLWEVALKGSQLTNNGMLVDFKDLKRAMKHVLDPLDHALVLNREDPLIKAARSKDMLRATNGEAPRLIIWDGNPTAESFAAWAYHEIRALSFKVAYVRVWETATSFAEYRGGVLT